MKVVIVESPAKAKTINKYLGRDFEVFASFGHVRDLPAKDGSVKPDEDFEMLWDMDAKASKRLSGIAAAVKDSSGVILATDPDREGEAISWHVLEVLKSKRVLKDKSVERVVFNAITRSAVLDAMKHPRAIDSALVDAYLARRALDYLVGFNLSPVLWRKLPGARSAGRVQSVALRLVADRELEIERFRPREYWSIGALLKTLKGAPFSARLTGADGVRISRLDVGSQEEAESFRDALLKAEFRVASIEAKPAKRHPSPPFTTSTLQQEASRKLGLAPARTMQIAQRLYEGVEIDGETVGLITYMRTDGVDMAPEAIAGARKVIVNEYGQQYLPATPRRYSAKAKNAQEAHEAIRPTDLARLPHQLKRILDGEQLKLYELIWTRTLASQMESAELERTTAEIEAKIAPGHRYAHVDLRATGQVVRFDGFLTLYQEGKDDEEDEESGRLPPMESGEPLTREKIDIAQHFTEPPPRFTEATLVKRMEELGIGRPSTYASTLAVLRDRGYVRVEKKRLVPEDKGRLVTAFLEAFFSRYVEYDFTADLEEKLDQISNNEIDWKQVLRDFWREFTAAVGATKDLRTTQVLDSLNEILGAHIFPAKEDGSDPRSCPSCGKGQLSLKLGKFGAFIGCSNYPECKYTRTLAESVKGEGDGEAERPGVRILGLDPESGLEVSLRDGRFGFYVQLGDGEKPKRASLPKPISPADLTLEQALALLSMPREVARHPESGEPIVVGIGRYGPYVQHARTYANLGPDDDVLEIGANRAIDLIIAKEQNSGGGRFGQANSGRALGDHPDGGAVTIRSGRFGPYVNWGKVNATVPKGTDLEGLNLDQGLQLLRAKMEGGSAVAGRILGQHPSGGQIVLRDGRYGAYVSRGKTNATLPSSMSPDSLSLEEAVRLIDEKGASPSGKSPGRAKARSKKAAPRARADATPAKSSARKNKTAPQATGGASRGKSGRATPKRSSSSTGKR